MCSNLEYIVKNYDNSILINIEKKDDFTSRVIESNLPDTGIIYLKKRIQNQ